VGTRAKIDEKERMRERVGEGGRDVGEEGER
jgi:hypothetical protein